MRLGGSNSEVLHTRQLRESLASELGYGPSRLSAPEMEVDLYLPSFRTMRKRSRSRSPTPCEYDRPLVRSSVLCLLFFLSLSVLNLEARIRAPNRCWRCCPRTASVFHASSIDEPFIHRTTDANVISHLARSGSRAIGLHSRGRRGRERPGRVGGPHTQPDTPLGARL